MWNRVVALIKKEFQQIRRDRKMRAMVLVAPVLQIVLLGYAANMDVYRVPLGVYDQDHGARSRELVDQFLNSGYFVLAAEAKSYDDLDTCFMDGRTEVNLAIPRNFSRDIDSGKGASLQLSADGAVSSSATIALSYASSIVARYGSGGMTAATAPEIRAWYNPELKTRLFMVPGVLALLLMMFTLIFTSLSVVKEKEMGTIEQLVVTPLEPTELIIGKLVPFALVSMVMSVLVIIAATIVFGIFPRGSILLLLSLCLVFILSTLGLGLFVSTIAANQQQAMFFSLFFFMFPMTILSGFVFPIENMPSWIQPITYLLPLRYFFVIVRGIYLKGDGMRQLWPQALALLAIGVAVISFSMLRFKKRLD